MNAPLSTVVGRALAISAAAFALAPARADVLLSGVDGNLATNVLAYLGVNGLACDSEPRIVRQNFGAAPGQIAEAVSVFGYYAPTVESSLEFAESCWQASFTIELGDPVHVRLLDVQLAGAAANDPEFTGVLDTSPLRVGAIVNHAAYDRLKRRLSDLARDRGYARAQFTASTLDIYPDELAADIVLHFDSGERYRFGDITLTQNVLRDDFVRSFIDLKRGDPYDNRQLTEVYAALTDSGYFQTIDVRALPPDHETMTIPVSIELTSAPRRLISYGVGFSTDTGPRLRFGRTIRRWNERGHQLGFNALLSPLVTEVSANYRLPYGDPRYEWASFDAGIMREDTDTSQTESIQFGARRVFERPGRWSRTQLLRLAVEDFEIAGQTGRSRLLMPGMDFTRIRTGNSMRPEKGSKIEFEVLGAADSLGSDTSFAQVTADTKWITSLHNRARVLIRGALGYTRSEDFFDLPPSIRFFAGGDNSIRGYGFETLGPTNADGLVIGGSRLAVASVEYEHPVRPRWSVAVFIDAGNAFEDSYIDTKKGAGLGARWQSPLGPIRLDIGVPVDDPDHGARLHVTLGPDL